MLGNAVVIVSQHFISLLEKNYLTLVSRDYRLWEEDDLERILNF